MKMQIIKFLTMLQPQYLFNIIEIILLILILNKLKEIFKEMWFYGKIPSNYDNPHRSYSIYDLTPD